jgi:type II secretory pathway pseudopilin PulG
MVNAAMRERGFTYLGVLLLVALMGAVLAGTATVWRTMSQRDKERELLFVGHEFRKAIGLYYERTPGGAKQFPKTLEDLLLDKRQLNVARYLRRLYVDPMTGKKEWGLVKGAGGTIMGVYSLSADLPIKSGNFDEADKDFEGTGNYAEWKFVYVPGQAGSTSAPPQGAPPPGTPPVAAPGAPVAAVPTPPVQAAPPNP